ncbi:MAG: CinA family protein [Bacteroidaceae bacterium]|nr:CinA family protein [Bacteroidaceae bacterium]
MEIENQIKNAAKTLVETLTQRGERLTCAESLTGGLVAATIVSVPGASNTFFQGLVTYQDQAKEQLLDIPHSVIAGHGAISSQTAELMARGAASKGHANMALATTGNAGPSAAEGKAVGLVFTSVYYNGKCKVTQHHYTGERNSIRMQTLLSVLEEAVSML